MMFKKHLWFCLAVVVVCIIEGILSVAIHRDTDVLKKSNRISRQINDLSDDDEDDYPYNPISAQSESRWESAEWPKPAGEVSRRRGGGATYESDEPDRPYSWFYYNKYLSNGPNNHLYNGPQVDSNAGIGVSRRNNVPRILPPPRPVASFGRPAPKKWE